MPTAEQFDAAAVNLEACVPRARQLLEWVALSGAGVVSGGVLADEVDELTARGAATTSAAARELTRLALECRRRAAESRAAEAASAGHIPTAAARWVDLR